VQLVGIAQRGRTLGQREIGDRCVRRVEREGIEASLEAHQQADDPPCDLGDDRQSLGPCIVEEMDSTTVIHPGYRADPDRWGNLVIAPSGGEGAP